MIDAVPSRRAARASRVIQYKQCIQVYKAYGIVHIIGSSTDCDTSEYEATRDRLSSFVRLQLLKHKYGV